MKSSTPEDILLQYVCIAVEIVYLFFYLIYCYLRIIVRKIIPQSPKSLDDDIVLITGAGNGIGRAIALELAKTCPNTMIVLWDINESGNKKTAKILRTRGIPCRAYTVDVTDRQNVERTAKMVSREIGDVTVLINNAGVAGAGSIFEQDPDLIEKTIKVNLTSHFWTLRAFLPKMMERNHGHVVTMCSITSYSAFRYAVPYVASKYGVRGYIRSLENELAAIMSPNECRIKFTTVYPYWVQTEMTSRARLNMKLNFLNEMLSPEVAARKTVDGFRRNMEKVYFYEHQEIGSMLMTIAPATFLRTMEHWLAQDSGYSKNNGSGTPSNEGLVFRNCA